MRIARSVTRIRRFDSPTHPPLHWDEDANSDSDSGDDITDRGKKKKANSENGMEGKEEEEGGGMETELPETGNEIARIYWKWFSSNKIIFRGRITTQSEFLPNTGKMRG